MFISELRVSRAMATAVCFVTILLSASAVLGQTTWYVDAGATGSGDCTSWDDACPDLQKALGLAQSGDQIWVAAGTYVPGPVGIRTATFQLKNGVALYGGFAGGEVSLNERDSKINETILSGDLNGDDIANLADVLFCLNTLPIVFSECTGLDTNGSGAVETVELGVSENSYHVVDGGSTDPTAVLDGFTISGGNADAVDGNGHPLFPDNSGGGMLNNNGSPTISHCEYFGNVATASGGGVFNNLGSRPIISHCRFRRNVSLNSGGGISNIFFVTNPVISHCTFVENFASLNGGGMHNADGANAIVSHCTFVENEAFRGGGVLNSLVPGNGILTFTNCVFSGNSIIAPVGGGGGMYNVTKANPTLINCTFSDNRAPAGTGGAMHNVGGINTALPILVNCILWNNLGGELEGLGIPIVSNSDVQGGIVGTGNINADPLFVDPLGMDGIAGTVDDDLRLKPGSPCINAGDNKAVHVDDDDKDKESEDDTSGRKPIDLDGNSRIVGGKVDMGAFEFQGDDSRDEDESTDEDSRDEGESRDVENNFTPPFIVEVVGKGRVGFDPERSAYNFDEVIVLNAIPEAGWRFDHWDGSIGGNRNPHALAVGEVSDKVMAVFTQVPTPGSTGICGAGVVMPAGILMLVGLMGWRRRKRLDI